MGRINFNVPDDFQKEIEGRVKQRGITVTKYFVTLAENDLKTPYQKEEPTQPQLKSVPALPRPEDIKIADTPAKRHRLVWKKIVEMREADPSHSFPSIELLAAALEAEYEEFGIIGGYALWMIHEVVGDIELAAS